MDTLADLFFAYASGPSGPVSQTASEKTPLAAFMSSMPLMKNEGVGQESDRS